MVEIVFDKENERIFNIIYKLQDYISDEVFELSTEFAELNFIAKLLYENENIKLISKIPMIWSVHYKYKYNNILFTIVYDEDYDFISFAVDNPEDRNEISKYISNLVEERRL